MKRFAVGLETKRAELGFSMEIRTLDLTRIQPSSLMEIYEVRRQLTAWHVSCIVFPPSLYGGTFTLNATKVVDFLKCDHFERPSQFTKETKKDTSLLFELSFSRNKLLLTSRPAVLPSHTHTHTPTWAGDMQDDAPIPVKNGTKSPEQTHPDVIRRINWYMFCLEKALW